MDYQDILANARGHMGACKVCPVCDGSGCRNTIPGPGAKGSGSVFRRNFEAWQKIFVNLDTICPAEPVDITFQMFGHSFSAPIFAAPIGAVGNHYGSELTEQVYDDALVLGCHQAGIAAFTGDGLKDSFFSLGCEAMAKAGMAIPTIKPWNRDKVFEKIDFAREMGARILCMDIDGAGLPFLKNMTPPSGPKSVEELREIISYAEVPFLIKGIMNPRAAEKALLAGASGIIVSNHGGRVLDQTPATADVLPAIVDAVGSQTMVLVDGGIRTGIDVFKALALGAKAVLIGRPYVISVYGGGAEGVAVYTKKLQTELRDTMEMCGVHKLAEITRDCLWKY